MIDLQAIRTGCRLTMACTLMGLGVLPLGCDGKVSITIHSIVKVQGGSIHGSSEVWTPTGSGGYSATPLGGSDSITTKYFQGTNLTNASYPGGWEIEISNSDGATESYKALMLCSDPSCKLTKISTNVVYLAPGRDGVSLSPASGGPMLSFHDDANCDHGTGTELKQCDKIVSIKITTAKAVQTLICQQPTEDPKQCEIDIGNAGVAAR